MVTLSRESGLWHYTVPGHVWKIVLSGEIRPATVGVKDGVKPAVWCSTNPVWEETSSKRLGTPRGIVNLDRLGTHAHFGLARISIRREAAPHTWAAYQRLSGETRTECRRLERVARRMGGWPDQWRCSFEPITGDDWLGIETWGGAAWEPLNDVGAATA